MGSVQQPSETDALIIGAGFGAYAMWKKLKEQNLGLRIKIYEKAPASGGVWYWNCYPGARVDTHNPMYQLFYPELYKTFKFSERFPGGPELREYFRHVEKTWNVTPDIVYNKWVIGATWDSAGHSWSVECGDGSITHTKWLLPCFGFASTTYTPQFPGLDTFAGKLYHTAEWPQDRHVDTKGKKVAVIGTGSSGVQIIQEIGDEVEHLTIYQRTPNYCIPMRQKKIDHEVEEKRKEAGEYEESYRKAKLTPAAFVEPQTPKSALDDTPEDREKLFHALWDYGGLVFWLANYHDLWTNPETNNEIYKFWRARVLERVKDRKKAELLAPVEAPHPWGTKRPSLEQRFYEVVDQDHIDIIDVNKSPIKSICPEGIITKEGLVSVDIIVLATGFDVGVGISSLNLVGVNGETIADKWSEGVTTYLGVAVAGFPNMLTIYGLQAPTAFGNGPSLTQYQAEWAAETIGMAERGGVSWFEARKEKEEEWMKQLDAAWDSSLFKVMNVPSWYNRSNVPGKKSQPLFWIKGVPQYMDILKASTKSPEGWIMRKK